MNKNKSHILVVDDDDRIRDLVKQYLEEKNFIVTNCDVLHDFNFKDFIKFHLYNKFDMSVVGSFKSYSIPYGICEVDKKGILSKIDEKPLKNIIINTGFYIINKNFKENS